MVARNHRIRGPGRTRRMGGIEPDGTSRHPPHAIRPRASGSSDGVGRQRGTPLRLDQETRRSHTTPTAGRPVIRPAQGGGCDGGEKLRGGLDPVVWYGVDNAYAIESLGGGTMKPLT